MADESLSAAPAVVATPAGNPSPTPAAPGSDTGGPAAGVSAAVADLAAKHGATNGAAKVSRPPGRPPIHGLYSKANGSDGKHLPKPGAVGAVESKPPVAPAPGPRVKLPADLVGKVAKAGASVAEQWAVNRTKAAAISANVSPAAAAPILESVRMTPEVKDLIGSLTPAALEECGLDAATSPTACLAGVVGVWAFGVWSAIGALQKEGTRQSPSPEIKTPPGANAAASVDPLTDKTVNLVSPKG